MTVDIDASSHGPANHFRGHRIADSRSVGIDQISLELAHLLGGEHHLAELSDPCGDPVHHLVVIDLPLDHLTAGADAIPGRIAH